MTSNLGSQRIQAIAERGVGDENAQEEYAAMKSAVTEDRRSSTSGPSS